MSVFGYIKKPENFTVGELTATQIAKDRKMMTDAPAYEFQPPTVWIRPIRTSAQLPEIGVDVMWWDGSWFFGALGVFENDGGDFGWKPGELYVDPHDEINLLQLKNGRVTHWLPLPSPPKD